MEKKGVFIKYATIFDMFLSFIFGFKKKSYIIKYIITPHR